MMKRFSRVRVALVLVVLSVVVAGILSGCVSLFTPPPEATIEILSGNDFVYPYEVKALKAVNASGGGVASATWHIEDQDGRFWNREGVFLDFPSWAEEVHMVELTIVDDKGREATATFEVRVWNPVKALIEPDLSRALPKNGETIWIIESNGAREVGFNSTIPDFSSVILHFKGTGSSASNAEIDWYSWYWYSNGQWHWIGGAPDVWFQVSRGVFGWVVLRVGSDSYKEQSRDNWYDVYT